MVRVFDSSASREGTRAPGEETQGIRPPFLNFFLNVLSFNTRACVRVISLSLSLSLSGSFLGVLASMSVRIDSLSLFYRNRRSGCSYGAKCAYSHQHNGGRGSQSSSSAVNGANSSGSNNNGQHVATTAATAAAVGEKTASSSGVVNGSGSGRGYNQNNGSNNDNKNNGTAEQQQREDREQQQLNVVATLEAGVHAKTINSRDRPRYKTRLCNSFRQEGTCRFGSACLFAHSSEELRKNTTTLPPAPITTTTTTTTDRAADVGDVSASVGGG